MAALFTSEQNQNEHVIVGDPALVCVRLGEGGGHQSGGTVAVIALLTVVATVILALTATEQ